MFTRVLVPLDGSKLAESALPAATGLAERLQIPVTLLHLIEADAAPRVHGDRHLTDAAEADAYLKQIAGRDFPGHGQVCWHVHHEAVADVAAAIRDHTAELGCDLIAMCSHGRSALGTLLLGTIAQRITGLGRTCILLVRPDARGRAPPFGCRRLLVPLDGQADHAGSLAVAAGLARVCGAVLRLLGVVDRTLTGEGKASARLLPRTTSEMLELQAARMVDYLQGLSRSSELAGIDHSIELRRGEPGAAIVEAASGGYDVVVLATHGTRVPDAFWVSSITPRVAGRCRMPLLLVPVGDSRGPVV
jgi:nucleotide-binding universal stress UspA family protein